MQAGKAHRWGRPSKKGRQCNATRTKVEKEEVRREVKPKGGVRTPAGKWEHMNQCPSMWQVVCVYSVCNQCL